MQRYFDQFQNCREHDIPYCADACPFKLDILDLQEKMSKNRYNIAYKKIRDAVVFPEIVSALCPGYCEDACIRKDIDEPVRISMLEKTAVAKASRKDPNAYNLPAKKGRIAVIGAGISGLGFAFRLASKKYDVTVFEKSGSLGGQLKELLPNDIFLDDIELQFKNEEYTLLLNSEINSMDDVMQAKGKESFLPFDVIYIASGASGSDLGLDGIREKRCMKSGETAILAGGSFCGSDIMHALADGLAASQAAEVYIKIGKLEYPVHTEPSHVIANRDLLKEAPAIKSSGGTFTDEEAASEAARCIKCQCDGCQNYCDLVGYFDKWPITMRDEILLTCKPSKSLVHKNPAMRYINACTQCGMFSEICPEGIDLCDMIKAARRKIHTLDKTPGAFRQYWLRDMEFANGKLAAVKKPAPGQPSCEYAFFPGCSLGALDPEYVIRPYSWLRAVRPDTGLLLRCCSVPVDWNGEETVHKKEIEKLKNDWESLGRPVLITACISCEKHLREYLPETDTVSLYEVMEKWGFEPGPVSSSEKVFSIFDPCSARNETGIQKAVRGLIARSGLAAEELPKGDRHGCCGFGGMGSTASPGFAEYVVQKRSSLSENPYLVYCANCRDVFCDSGKSAVHILDLLFDIDADGKRPQPGVSQRRINRVRLKETLLETIWGEEMEEKPAESKYELTMSDEMRAKANKLRILDDDIYQVIARSEQTLRRTLDPENGHYKAYSEIGNITCWVEYLPKKNGYRIFNIYTHRMKIELEAVFNGKKIDM